MGISIVFDISRLPGMYCDKACLMTLVKMEVLSLIMLMITEPWGVALLTVMMILGFAKGFLGDMTDYSRRELAVVVVVWWVLLFIMICMYTPAKPFRPMIIGYVGICMLIDFRGLFVFIWK